MGVTWAQKERGDQRVKSRYFSGDFSLQDALRSPISPAAMRWVSVVSVSASTIERRSGRGTKAI
jgi:hypothetical protein